jgi:peptidoglycan/LPS O-acetylase OafA/YrhL
MKPRRIPALDGLRGIAAFVVVIHHALVASVPALAAVYIAHRHLRLSPVEWALARTPLHVIWAGPEFVIVFFVLSGFVLTLPALDRLDLRAYYPSRLLRLYLPVFAALMLAAWWRFLVPHRVSPGASWWLNWHMAAGSLSAIVRIGTLMLSVGSPRGGLTVLWSLHWEVLFSLALPLVVLLVRRVPAPALIVLCLAASLSSRVQDITPFIIGAALATRWEQLGRLPEMTWLTVPLVAVAVLGLTADWWLGGSGVAAHLATPLVAVGAIAVVGLALTRGRVFEKRPVQWAGSRSYSVYLVHEPVIVCAALLLHSWVLVLIAGIPVAAAVSEMFFRAAERPAHRVSRGARQALSASSKLVAEVQPSAHAVGVPLARHARLADDEVLLGGR